MPDGVRPHLPLRPLWLCRVCGTPWPCATARLKLKCEYADDRTGLSVYLCSVLHEAIADLCRLDPANPPAPHATFTRFVAWAKPRLPD
ncbi:hypothetical protein ACFQ0D_35110 [Micromonospora zhanjiangensis]